MVLLLSNLALINKDHMFSPPSLSVNTTNMTIDDAIQCNRDWSVNEQQLFYFPLCQYTALGDLLGICKYSQVGTELISLVNFVNQDLPKDGYKMILIGNSWVPNHQKLFHQECGNKSKSIMQIAAYGCEPLYPSLLLDRCKSNLETFSKSIEDEKPDFVFIFTR